ncbi:synaptic vesicle 2-related protein-like isoform X2 [Saccostrea cucullata]|uniref:synaptic vesicle 2-related protein-like isoform X2 n=1 Tax=Saccostrea cuccullata TaxID=36930 RepID=UPI002ED64841
MRKSYHILFCLTLLTTDAAAGRPKKIVECTIDKTWFRIARILLQLRVTQRPLKFHEYAERITPSFKRGCPVLDCPSVHHVPRICRIPTVFKFWGRTCKGCHKNRGKCMVGVTFCGALGAVFAGGMAWWLLESYSWRHFMAACAAPAFIVCIAAFCLTEESPRFLFISGQEHRGKMVLQKMIHEPLAWQGEIECMPSEKRGRISQLFAPGTRLKTINIALIWFLQATGYWGVTVYLPEYMGSLGVDPYFNMFTVFIGELPGLCLAMIMIEPYMLGRIRCLQLFSFSTCISLLLFAFVGMDFLKAVSVIVCYFFMVPIYSILSTFTPEAYPTHIRSTAVATMYMIIEIPGLITPFVGEYLLSSDITWLYPVVWAGVFFLQALAICGLRSETAGKALKDSDKENDSDKETLSDEMAESAIS